MLRRTSCRKSAWLPLGVLSHLNMDLVGIEGRPSSSVADVLEPMLVGQFSLQLREANLLGILEQAEN